MENKRKQKMLSHWSQKTNGLFFALKICVKAASLTYIKCFYMPCNLSCNLRCLAFIFKICKVTMQLLSWSRFRSFSFKAFQCRGEDEVSKLVHDRHDWFLIFDFLLLLGNELL